MIQDLIKKHDGSRFQAELSKFIFDHNLKTIVETGMGVSSIFILNGFDLMSSGSKEHHLISIDPSAWFEDRFDHPNHTLIEKKSVDAMLDTYYQYGPWDCFLHDGDHEILCQTYEYAFAYDCLKPGGYLFSDDTNWNNNGAWDKFCQDKGLKMFKLGDTFGVQKPLESSFCPSSEASRRHETYLAIATKAEEEWLAAGGIKHPAFR